MKKYKIKMSHLPQKRGGGVSRFLGLKPGQLGSLSDLAHSTSALFYAVIDLSGHQNSFVDVSVLELGIFYPFHALNLRTL